MESFLGYRVRLDLRDGASMEGIIDGLDEPGQLITLSEVTCRTDGKVSKFPGLLEVFGGDVVNLEILPEPVKTPGSKKSSPMKKKGLSKNDSWLAASRSKKDELAALKAEDFDFQANLQLFDKKKVFTQIRAEDSTSVDDRLVAHNLSGRGQQLKAEQSKIKHTENVLARPLEDVEQDERILALRSPIMMMQIGSSNKIGLRARATDLTFKTANGLVIDPSSFGQATPKHLWVQVEETGKSLAAYLADQSPKAVDFFCGSSAFLDAVIYCAARHLTMAGIYANVIISGDKTNETGDIVMIHAQHKAYYEQVLAHLSPPLLLTHDETLIVNGLRRDFDRPSPPSAHIVALDHVSSQQNSVLFFSMAAIGDQAEALEALHPRTDIYWLNSGQLQDPQSRQVFASPDKVGFGPYVRLRPFVR